MKRVYEELFIVRPDATDEEIDPLIEQLTTLYPARAATSISPKNGASANWPIV